MRVGQIRKLVAGLALMALVSSTAQADYKGYDGKVSISAETSDLRAEHSHDWSKATREARWKMISTTEDPFSAENNYSYLELRDKAKDIILFHRPVPALSYIWISPNSKYVVGLSNIKRWNPYQMVVYNKSGDCLFKLGLEGARLKSKSESVTNWIHWYREPVPKIEIIENGPAATLLVEEGCPIGQHCGPGGFNRFEFTTAN